MKDLKKYKRVLYVSMLVALIPTIRSVLEFKYDRFIDFPLWFRLILIIFGQILPLIFYIKLIRDEEINKKGRYLSVLLFASLSFNLNLLRLTPYFYVKYDGMTVMSAYLEYFGIILILIAVFVIYFVITNIMKIVKNKR